MICISKSATTWSEVASPILILQGRQMGRSSENPVHDAYILSNFTDAKKS